MPPCKANVFALAGVRKNMETDAWEFASDTRGPKPGPTSVLAEPMPAQDAQLHSIVKKRKPSCPNRSGSKRKKSVRWGEVHEVGFSRGVGYVCIPADGGYPIGLGEKLHERRYAIDTQDAESVVDKRGRRNKKSAPQAQPGASRTAPAAVKFEPIAEKDRIAMLQQAIASSSNSSNVHCQDVTQHNKDIKEIQHSRLRVGCSCKPLKVDKLSVVNLRKEISARAAKENLPDLEKMKKAELAALLKSVLGESSTLCSSASECECVRNEIPCNSHCQCPCQGASSQAIGSSCCSNPSGHYCYDEQKVRDYRQMVVKLMSASGDLFVLYDGIKHCSRLVEESRSTTCEPSRASFDELL